MLPSADRATSASAASSIVTLLARVTLAQLLANGGERQRLQLEHLRPRLDGGGHRVQLGRRHHELHVRRRLLDGLQQRVERVLRQAMDFVDDEDLVAIAHRRNRQRLDDDLANGVDAGVGGAVNLEDVHVAAFGDFAAGIAVAARLAGRPVHAVERARHDARGRRLPHAARAREDERLREPARRDGVLQRVDDAALADDVFEPLRTPFARQVRGGTWMDSGNFEVRSSKFEVSCPRARPRPGGPAAQHRIDLALLPSGPDAVRRLNLHRVRTAVRHVVLWESIRKRGRRTRLVRGCGGSGVPRFRFRGSGGSGVLGFWGSGLRTFEPPNQNPGTRNLRTPEPLV